MINSLLDFSKFEDANSKFNAQLEHRGGNITFSNSGKGGNKKYFNLSLDTFLTCLTNIKSNITKFQGHENYIEKEWRDLGSSYYSDKPANAQSTVQTKPMFATLSKIIMWANSPKLDILDPEKQINLDLVNIEMAIKKVNELAERFSPKIDSIEDDSDVINLKEKFADWLIQEDGGRNNYFSTNFSSNRDKLIKILDHYNHLYFKDFSLNLFEIQIEYLNEKAYEIENNIYNKKKGDFFEYSKKTSRDMPRAILGKENYLAFLKEQIDSNNTDTFNINLFRSDCKKSGLYYDDKLITRYISSLVTKPFVLLSGLSGSGKTKLAQSFSQWICEDNSQYCIVPVGADWTNREPLLGYVNALDEGKYILPENGALQLIIEANEENNQYKPYFLILDEMNLSHVERYFADFLSVMESKDKFKLHSSNEPLIGKNNIKVNKEYTWPKNLFVIGTVNIDETTYMFSPKVLDRANVIEFRVNNEEIKDFLAAAGKEIIPITKKGAAMGNSFVSLAKKELNKTNFKVLDTELLEFFKELQVLGAEFGYRTAAEIQALFSKIDLVNPKYSSLVNDKIDIAIMQKLLPKLHGSGRKLRDTLKLLAQKCLEENQDVIFNDRGIYNIEKSNSIKYNLSFKKIARMYKNAIENGFASYAEA